MSGWLAALFASIRLVWPKIGVIAKTATAAEFVPIWPFPRVAAESASGYTFSSIMLTPRTRNARSLFRALAYPSLAVFGIIALACGASKPTGGPGGDGSSDNGSDTSDGHSDGQNHGVGGNASAGGGGNQGTGADGSGASNSDGEDFDDLVIGGGGKGTYVPPEEEEFCDSVAVSFVPKTPTVYVLVDRSTSMWDSSTPTYWDTLRGAVLPVIQELQADVRLGFGTFTGTSNSCDGLTDSGVPFAENSYAAIRTAYEQLNRPEGKTETPTAKAIQQATDLLLADDSPGDRYILLVTDGDPDFCDDPDAKCAADTLIAELQVSAAKGVRTLVFGIEDSSIDNPEWFDFYAQAGWGELPNWTTGLTVNPYNGPMADSCRSIAAWSSARTASGNAPDPATCSPLPPEGNPECFLPAGKYDTAPTTKKAFMDADPAALAAQIQSSLEALKSCIFDLSHSNVEVKEDKVATGQIYVNEELIPSTDWRMNDPTTLELLGESCDTWLKPEVTQFFAGFPCDALIIK